MTWLAINSAVLTFLLILIAFRSPLTRDWNKNKRLEQMKNRARYLDAELELNFMERFFKPVIKKITASLNKLNKPKRQAKVKRDGNSALERNLRLAGLRISGQEFFMIRIASAVGLLFVGFAVAGLITKEADIQFLIILIGMTIGLVAPTFALRSFVNSRQEAIQNQLPTVMDILSVSIEAGLGFDAALLKVVERYEGPLIDEMALLYREIQMGKPRREAMVTMASRSNVPELQTFVTAVIQSDQFGTPIKNVLRNQAIQLRVSRRQQAQEKGMKAPVKMVIPMVIFIFPVIFIVLLGPTVIQLIRQFG
ncbi:MAG: type II secretion system F family protein [Eubacteriales bacterium]|nr:type II secretion system F family protein [Eubacteriales bacterium]